MRRYSPFRRSRRTKYPPVTLALLGRQPPLGKGAKGGRPKVAPTGRPVLLSPKKAKQRADDSLSLRETCNRCNRCNGLTTRCKLLQEE